MFQNNSTTKKSYSEVLTDLNRTTKALILNDLKLVNQDLKKIGKDLKTHTSSLAVFGCLFLLSAIPLLIFSILLLGEALNDRYWLSSLIIGVTLFAGGYFGVMYFYRKLKRINFKLEKTSFALKREGEIIYRQFNKLQDDFRATP